MCECESSDFFTLRAFSTSLVVDVHSHLLNVEASGPRNELHKSAEQFGGNKLQCVWVCPTGEGFVCAGG